ncbi:MAG TPA: M3 family metallopeptidase [Candidatus Eisenbacteria bacterium]|nr:M3 family metallopeptidase [Candidatus Eisenbacteria bacterium]
MIRIRPAATRVAAHALAMPVVAHALAMPVVALALAMPVAALALAMPARAAGPRLTSPAAPHQRPPHVPGPAVTRDSGVDATPFLTGIRSAADFTAREDERLARAERDIGRLAAVTGPHTIANTLRPYDDAIIELEAASAQAGLMSQVHPDSAFRAAADEADRKVSAFETNLSLDRRVYDALVAIDLSHADAETQYYVTKLLRDFRLSGVDRDDSTRARIRRLSDELTLIGQSFAKNIRNDLRKVRATPAELDGLPADFIARHTPGPDGAITLTIDYPDDIPVMTYANSEALRKRMMMQYANRGYPDNMAVLDSMLSKRWQLANLCGYTNWADYVTSNKMVGSARNASEFIDRIVDVSGPRAQREYQVLLHAKQQDVPGATDVKPWESSYYAERVRKADYDFDAQKMRPYFPYDRVKQGVLDVTSRMFGVTYRRVNVPVWDPSVEAYEALDHGQLIGRFYLDMHPRHAKYNHAAQFRIRTGVAGRQIPEAALICNLPGGVAGDPGLCEQDDVETFFHEFGHLLHQLFAGRHAWVGTGGIRTERDFVEAPSQMLEEWMKDPAVLATFARHYQTNEPIPAALVKQMVRANKFGEGLGTRRQMVYARTSLSYYDRDPKTVNTDSIATDLETRYTPFGHVPGTHFQCAFGHLDGYSAVYYTYMWSLVIAKDMFSRFDHDNLLDPRIAARYRQTVLAPGGSAPAAKLVENFLGRPFSFEAYRTWLNEPN